MSPKPQKRVTGKVIPLPNTKEILSAVPNIIAIPSNGRIDVIRTEDILYFRSENNYTHIFMASGGQLIASMTLRLFDMHLKGGQFLRVHNQFLVHRKYISAYIHKTNQLILTGQTKVPVSRNKKVVLMDFLRSLMIQTS